ncbi:MAG: hypothetical protein JXO44_10360 [Clostridia bacterium]|nr:hypothetical protein [Clostridia bacterium]
MTSQDMMIQIETLQVKAIEYFFTKHSNKVLEAAKEAFLKGIESSYREYGFDNWLLCDFEYEGQNMMTYYSQNQPVMALEKPILQTIKDSWFSYFEVFEIEGKSLIKDLFTKDDYRVENSELLSGGTVVAARLYPLEDKVYIEIFESFDAQLHQHVSGAVLAKYNEYCSQNGTIEIDTFIKSHSVLLYKFMNVFKNVSNLSEEDSEEEYMVYQSDYVFEDRDKIIDALSTEGCFEFLEKDSDYEIYSYTCNGVIVEILITQHKMEIEAPTESSRQIVKEKIETLLEGYINFVQDLTLQIDDIL